MNYLAYPLEQNKFVNRFVTTEPFCQPKQFKKAVLQGRVNEWLKYGFSIHENPCRKEFLGERLAKTPAYLDLTGKLSGDSIAVFDSEKPLKLYFPFGNVNVESSGFYYTPTFLRTYSYTYLYSPAEHQAEFEVCTCGGVTIWANDDQICDFTPFTRNLRKMTNITMNLKAGLNKIVTCLDDLAERDTDYYFRLAYLGNETLEIRLPVAENVNIGEVRKCEAMISTIYFKKDVYLDEQVDLSICNPLARPVKVAVSYLLSINNARIHKQETLIKHLVRTLPAGQKGITIFDTNEVPPNYYYFMVSVTIDDIQMGRKIGTQIFTKGLMVSEDLTLAERKQKLLQYVCDNGIENIYRCAAKFQLERNNADTEQTILEELDGIEMRKDCSDFHLAVILLLYHRYSERMSQRLQDRIREVAVQFRYWIDEPGDDVMWFFSENHALLFHICQYAAGSLFPDDIFPNSGLTGSQQKERALALLEHWFTEFFKEFITEWNSNAYIPVDTLGFGVLYGLTENGDRLHEYAKRALDMVFYNLSINAHQGAIVTSFGRSYEEQLKGNYASGTTGLLYLGFNRGYINNASMSYVTLAMDDYEPPAEYLQYIDLAEGESLIFENTQGFEQHVNLYMYKNKQVQLSTAVDFKPFQAGYQEHIVQASIDPIAQVFLNHPGESQPYGSGRPSYWAGSGTLPRGIQYGNTSVITFDIDANHLIDYTHIYFPMVHFDQFIMSTNYIAGKKGDGYIGAYTKNGLLPVVAGPLMNRELRSFGRKNVWVLTVATTDMYPTIEDFAAAVSSVVTEQGADKAVRVTAPDGTLLEIDSQGKVTANGADIYHFPLSPQGKITKCRGDHS